MGIKLELTGDWQKANSYFNKLGAELYPAYVSQILSDGEYVVEKLKGHIDAQDLGWAPNAPSTIRQKGGSKVYVETGALYGSIEVREGGGGGDFSVTCGPSSAFSQVMGWLEGGTTRQPPRPLLAPTAEEVKPVIKEHWIELFKSLVKG